jgi:hypothetical protein
MPKMEQPGGRRSNAATVVGCIAIHERIRLSAPLGAGLQQILLSGA